MNARERVLKAINHEEPDRVPLFCQVIMPEFKKRLLEHWGNDFKKDRKYVFYVRDYNLERKLGFDCSWGAWLFPLTLPGSYLKEHPTPNLDDPTKYVDYDGRIQKKTTAPDSDVAWYLTNYIKTEEMADFFHDTYYSIQWEEVPDFVAKTNQKLKKFHVAEIVPCPHLLSILEPLWEGMGLGLLMKLILKNKQKLKKYIDMRAKIGVQFAKLFAETDFDVFFMCDDTALKNTTMISPQIHRELIVPAYKAAVQILRKAGKYVIFHSDGFTEPYFNGLIEAGFNGVESLEPFAGMNLKHLKETYGDKLCLIGNIDVSGLLPFGSPVEVTETVKKCIKDAGNGGGYILSPCTDITNACKVENVLAMIDATKKFGKYPLKI